ncbi:MAG: alpha/beta hydrolase [Bradyrhizobium sp.]|jgi:pimeloyl-ACP methyl ester carboxylesterase|uniref:alpha/beta fold hydrolase n=1 Tax=Bradyrhizobium sp. TaxID=376 RepID=UPI00121C5B86|nr:alpha/beta hydrolase family protein [Bradyrhizobium sp.]THD49253.1 MAG: alpha/beta hydrolase [Bradyrhizobium sp.]
MSKQDSRTATQTTRRAALGAIAGFGAVAAGGLPQLAQAQGVQKTFVLVHGTWHGGWCWRRVADALEKKGHKVYAPSLTGLADRSHLLTRDVNLTTHVSDVVNLVKWEDLKDVVLVGHSSAGFVITEAAEQIGPSVASIVYLDAFVPQPGDNLISLANPGPRKALEDAVARGDLVAKPVPAAAFKVNEKDRAWVDAKCTAHPLAAVVEKITGAAAREKIARKTYIRASGFDSPVFDQTLARLKTAPGWKTYEVSSGHDVMVDMPDRLVEILIEVA